jgi:hypothetical protein
MSVLNDYRERYPRYKDVDDETLARALYEKHYSDKMSYDDFSQQAGISPVLESMSREYYGEPVVKDGQYQVGGPATVKAEEIAGGAVERLIRPLSSLVQCKQH